MPIDELPTDPAAARSTRPLAGANEHEVAPGAYVREAGALGSITAVLPELKLLIGLLVAALIIAGLYLGKGIVMPLALALLLGFVLDPWVTQVKRLGVPRTAAVIIVVTFTLLLLVLAGLLLGSQVRSVSQELPTYQTNVQAKLSRLRERSGSPGMFDGVVQIFETIRKEVDRAPGAPVRTRGRNASNPDNLPQVQIAAPASAPFEQAMTWLEAIFKRAATAGIVIVFTVLVLLDRVDLRDRLLRLWSGNLHRSTDALDEAGQRISRYLTMQLVVNLSYGIPMALGLWLIGVPGAILWGAVAAVLRFVPYLGPVISAVFPLALAFAVDPGWSMILWTIAFIAVLELVSNNVVEPWLYGASTGLSTLSLIVSATFWTALWGPIGLVMSTPLTVCLMVIGRHLPRLKFLDVLLGSQPALEMPTRVYQRLLAGDVEEAVELATSQVAAGSLVDFYSATAIPVLRMASEDHASVATAQHRHRLVTGMDALIDELRDSAGEQPEEQPLDVVCIGGKWEIDSLAAKMLAHALTSAGRSVAYRPAAPLSSDWIASLDLRGAKAVCVSYFSPRPEMPARALCKRLRRRWPDVQIVLALWNAPAELLTETAGKALGADAVVTWLNEAVMLLQDTGRVALDAGYLAAPVPPDDAARLAALRASGALDPRAAPLFDAASHRAADIFDVGMAMVSLIGAEEQTVPGAFGSLPVEHGGGVLSRDDLRLPRALSMCGHVAADGATLVVPDVSRDMRFANNPAVQGKLRFYAGAPLRDDAGHVLGSLCLLGAEPRKLTERDVKLLEALARDLMVALRDAKRGWNEAPASTVVAPAVGALQ